MGCIGLKIGFEWVGAIGSVGKVGVSRSLGPPSAAPRWNGLHQLCRRYRKTINNTSQVGSSRNVRRIRNHGNSHFLKYRRVFFSKTRSILPSRRNLSRAPDKTIREFTSPICRRNQVVVCMLAYFRLKQTLPTKTRREQF